VTASPLVQATTVRASVQVEEPSAARVEWDTDGIGDALAGRLVHRMFQALDPSASPGRGPTDLADEASLGSVARSLVQDEERAAVPNLDDLVEAACSTWRDLHGREDVQALFDGARASYEVPFTLRLPEAAGGPVRVVRGAIDCLLVRLDGEVTVVEIKTGRPRPWHRDQLALYVRAAEALLPGARVRGVLLSPAGQDVPDA
jgi:ATP-dependent exoDNAse (exonuclease V) beta subunit